MPVLPWLRLPQFVLCSLAAATRKRPSCRILCRLSKTHLSLQWNVNDAPSSRGYLEGFGNKTVKPFAQVPGLEEEGRARSSVQGKALSTTGCIQNSVCPRRLTYEYRGVKICPTLPSCAPNPSALYRRVRRHPLWDLPGRTEEVNRNPSPLLSPLRNTGEISQSITVCVIAPPPPTSALPHSKASVEHSKPISPRSALWLNPWGCLSPMLRYCSEQMKWNHSGAKNCSQPSSSWASGRLETSGILGSPTG